MPHCPLRTHLLLALVHVVVAGLCVPVAASAQPLGTFRWQQQPYCNVVTLNVVQAGAVYQVDGFDDQCGAGTRASAVGLAFPNPNGTIGFGLTIVTSPGGTPVHLDASIDLASLSGSWRDGSGSTGAFTFLTGGVLANSGARPVPRVSFPGGLSAGGATVANVAAPTVASDAANKAYVDANSTADRAFAKQLFATTVNYSAYGARTSGAFTDGASGCLSAGNTGGQLQLDLPLPIGAVPTSVTVKYIDTSSNTMSIGLRVYTLQEGVSRTDDAAASALSTSNGAVQGIRVQTITVTSPQPVTAARGYYLNVSATPADFQTLAFCGAQVTYTIP